MGDNCLLFVTEVPRRAARCRYGTTAGDELIRDQFVAEITCQGNHEQHFLQTDDLTIDNAFALVQNYMCDC